MLYFYQVMKKKEDVVEHFKHNPAEVEDLQLRTEGYNRKEIVKIVKKMSEETKVAIRNIRRDANEDIKKTGKDNVSEDDIKRSQEDIQKLTDQYTHKIDEILHKKELEIMEV